MQEVFDEDDVLQEIKSMNTRLIDLYVFSEGGSGCLVNSDPAQ